MHSPNNYRHSEQKGIARRLEVVLQSRPESADLAETLLAQFSEQAGCTEEEQNQVALAVRESVINAVLHGNRGQARKKVFLCAQLSKSGMEVSVRDQGKGFNPRTVADPCSPENLMRESGRGILMIRTLMDRVAIRRTAPHGTEVRMVKYLVDHKDPKTSLNLATRHAHNVTILDVNGRIVLGEPAQCLHDALQNLVVHGHKKVLLNLAGVDYIDSSGLGSLVGNLTSVASQHGQMKLLHLTRKVRGLLRITKLLGVFEVFENEHAALESFR